ncbi:MAG: 16S rRNA (uracil(1498)-N(3))-methyltransferase [Parahaliea sp.]
MNLLLFSQADLITPKRLRLTDRRLQYLHEVHRAQVGDTLRVGQINGLIGTGQLEQLDNNSAEVSFQLNTPPPPALPVTVVLALPRPKMLRRILHATAEFGVKQLYLINSARVEKSYWQTPVLRPESVREFFLQGLEQGRDTYLPQLHLESRFKPFIEDRLPALASGKRCLLAHPGPADKLLASNDKSDTLLAIGPEGGFIPYEVDKLLTAGFEPVSLGTRILRVENAFTASLGRLLSTSA